MVAVGEQHSQKIEKCPENVVSEANRVPENGTGESGMTNGYLACQITKVLTKGLR